MSLGQLYLKEVLFPIGVPPIPESIEIPCPRSVLKDSSENDAWQQLRLRQRNEELGDNLVPVDMFDKNVNLRFHKSFSFGSFFTKLRFVYCKTDQNKIFVLVIYAKYCLNFSEFTSVCYFIEWISAQILLNRQHSALNSRPLKLKAEKWKYQKCRNGNTSLMIMKYVLVKYFLCVKVGIEE